MHCPRCEADNPEGMKFCIECAAPLMRRCPQCSVANPPQGKFCGQCATSLSGQIPTPHPLSSPTSAAELYSRSFGRENPHLPQCPGGRAQAGHGAVCRPQRLHGVARRPRPRRRTGDARPRPRTSDGGGPPLRGDGESGHGRRHYGPRSTICVELRRVLRIAHPSIQIMSARLYPPLCTRFSPHLCVHLHTRSLTSLHHTTIQRDGSRTRDEGAKRNRSCTDASSAELPRGGSTPRARHRLSHPAREKRMIANAPV
jgi:hypothetical protein